MYFRDIMREITGHNVIEFDEVNNPLHKSVISILKKSLELTRSMRFYARRPNDVSNNTCVRPPLEEAIVDNFNKISGDKFGDRFRAKWLASSGYPDIVIIDKRMEKPVTYIEVKTTARANMGSPRDFYVSPGRVRSIRVKRIDDNLKFEIIITPTLTRNKVRGDAPHIMILFKIYQLKNCTLPEGVPYECRCWGIRDIELYDLYGLKLRVKLEFNSNYSDIIDNCRSL